MFIREIFIFGDSHSIIYSQVSEVHEHWLCKGNLPVTMHRVGNEGLDIKSVPIILGNGHQKYIPKENDYVIYSYGYNDIQKNIYLQIQKQRDLDEIINSLIDKYIQLIIHNNKKYKVIGIIYGILPASFIVKESIKGDVSFRTDVTVKFNSILKEKSIAHNIPFFDLYQLFNDNGCISKKYSTDGIHIDLKFANIVKEKLDNFIGSLDID